MDKGKIKAKSLKLGENDIICPNCNSVLTIDDEIKNEEYIQCPKCDIAIINPFCDLEYLICGYCGNETDLPKELENELMVNCGACGESIYNIYSDKYNPVTCPNCQVQTHVPDDVQYARYFNCPFCKYDFKNPLR